MFDVITFGSATQDVFLRSRAMELHKEHGVVEACFPFGAKLNVEEMAIETGGGGTNNAVTFARMARMKTAVVTAVGDDNAGRTVTEEMRHEGVATEFIQHLSGEKTGFSTIILSGEAERTILVHRGASELLDAKNIPWERMNARLFHVSSLAGDLKLLSKIIDRAQKTNAKVFMNPGGKEIRAGRQKTSKLFGRLDLVLLNREEAAELTGVNASNLRGLIAALRKTCRLAVLTDGRNGSYAVTPEETVHASVLPAKRVNLTGAGDAFGSAFAAGLLKTGNVKTALAVGTANATSIVQKMGAKVGILHGWPALRDIRAVKIKKIKL